ncbi:LysR family substrate-binding domain-containing protein [Lolliginicoccus levis]|uniref:LysR family substrate-binding domain-containing protein n=1 Tax=Lolliginicoccus levis TaxID=2919542 RepID=UPI00241EDF8C|nr:LysR family substrate-binding domain-containing protein [Lolliginicoccus levis]
MSAFRLGYVPGVMPSKWARRWAERLPGTRLDLVPLPLAGQRAAILDGEVDAALVRVTEDPAQPWDGFSVIPLYREEPVVVCGRDHYLAAADRLALSDLEGEIAWQPLDDPLDWAAGSAPGQRPDQRPPSAAEAIEMVATGIGFVIVPLSLGRLHHRKDIVSIPLIDGPEQQVGIAWPSDRSTNDDPLLEEMVGIVRGRTARSSRGVAAEPASTTQAAPKVPRQGRASKTGSKKAPAPRKRAPRRR